MNKFLKINLGIAFIYSVTMPYNLNQLLFVNGKNKKNVLSAKQVFYFFNHFYGKIRPTPI